VLRLIPPPPVTAVGHMRGPRARRHTNHKVAMANLSTALDLNKRQWQWLVHSGARHLLDALGQTRERDWGEAWPGCLVDADEQEASVVSQRGEIGCEFFVRGIAAGELALQLEDVRLVQVPILRSRGEGGVCSRRPRLNRRPGCRGYVGGHFVSPSPPSSRPKRARPPELETSGQARALAQSLA